jgi:hypothetical protein
MKRTLFIVLALCQLLCFNVVTANQQDGRVRPVFKDNVSSEFMDVLDEGIQSGRTSSLEGDYFYLEKFSAEYRLSDGSFKLFRMFDQEVPNLVILADVTWLVGGNFPSTIDTGCGFVFQNNDDSREEEPDSFMHAQIVMEGKDFL